MAVGQGPEEENLQYDAFTPTEIAALGEMIIFEGEEAAEDD